ncbi:hypothetical protein [Streptomyces sp. NPDC047525]|uniref:hypothetical protein n=1 Tax=Streptomyces sp. NPDC047525 TaxID=3155264 RepID=UPI0033FD6DB1
MSLFQLISLIVASASAGAGAAGAYVALTARRRTTSAQRFMAVRSKLSSARAELTEACLAAHKEYRHDPGIPLLQKPGWIPGSPLDLGDVSLSIDRQESSRIALVEAQARLLRYWPLTEGGTHIGSYSDAIEIFARPSLWANGRSYRLMSVRSEDELQSEAELALSFTLANYFDMINTSEPLGYELAARLVDGRSLRPVKGRYRRWLGDPFAFDRRCALPGINTLTVRRGAEGAYFFLHDRRASAVATAMGAIHVAPAREFQPTSGLRSAGVDQDFDIWHSVLRSYSEEFLGVDSSQARRGATYNYAEDPPYSELDTMRRNHDLEIWFLGIGLDPVTWKPEILTVVVFEETAFNRVFGPMLSENSQGPFVRMRDDNSGYAGLLFTRDIVKEYEHSSHTLPAGRACLSLAWRWRKVLKIPIAEL